jgi:hypothetical protein
MANDMERYTMNPYGIFEAVADRTERLLARYAGLGLADLERVALLDRVDTKYVFGASQLYAALRALPGQYRALEVEGVRLNRYQTVYFDTPDFGMYRQHHNRFGTRYKVRTRRYVDSDLSFFEVKHKTNRGRTVKTRFPTEVIETEIDDEADAFVGALTPLPPDRLEPVLWNEYLRATLVSTRREERLTLDVNLAFGWGDAGVTLPGIAIAEVKQRHLTQDSDFIRQMREMGVRSTPFSKYCMGASLLYGDLKSNNFKPHLRLVEKIMREESARQLLPVHTGGLDAALREATIRHQLAAAR